MASPLPLTLKSAIAGPLNWLRWKFSPKCDTSFLTGYDIDDLFFNDYHATYKWKCRKADSIISIRGKDLLVLGCGEGKELEIWNRYLPNSVSGTDLLEQRTSWKSLPAKYQNRLLQASVLETPFKDNSFDLVCSDAVFEHVTNMPLCMKELGRILRPRGFVYASFGPLYHTWGGPHTDFGMEGGYDHLLLSKQEYGRKVKTLPKLDNRIWWEKGLLSGLKADDYLDLFRKDFDLCYLAIIISWQGIRFRKLHPNQWNKLRDEYDEKDLMIKSLIVVLQKKTGK